MVRITARRAERTQIYRTTRSTRATANTHREQPGRFFLHAEGGIRYLTVTGVQTCALPICPLRQLLQHVLQLSHRRPGGFGARLREQERELIAAQPGDDVAGPHGVARRPGHEPQHLVAHLVGEEVAQLAKVIEAEIGDRERVRVAPRALEFSAGELVEGQPILEPRQVVGAALCASPARSAHPEIEVASGREDCEDDSDVPDHAGPAAAVAAAQRRLPVEEVEAFGRSGAALRSGTPLPAGPAV